MPIYRHYLYLYCKINYYLYLYFTFILFILCVICPFYDISHLFRINDNGFLIELKSFLPLKFDIVFIFLNNFVLQDHDL